MATLRWNLRLLMFALLPAAAALVVVPKLLQLRLAYSRGLIAFDQYRRIWLAFGAGAFYGLLFVVGYFFETTLWPVLLGGLLAGGMVWLLRDAQLGLHPGLHGLARPLPSDGLLAAVPESGGTKIARRMRNGALFVPLGVLFALALAPVGTLRPFSITVIGLALLAPLTVLPSRRLPAENRAGRHAEELSPDRMIVGIDRFLRSHVKCDRGQQWITRVSRLVIRIRKA